MSVRISTQRTANQLAMVSAALNNLKPFIERNIEELHTMVMDAFGESQSPSGEPFDPLDRPSYKRVTGRNPPKNAVRAATRYNSSVGRVKPLINSGRMRRTFRVTATRYGIRFGFGVDYAAWHTTGTGNIPKRNVLPVEVDAEGNASISTRGAAGAFWQRFQDRLKAYIENAGNVV